MIDVLEQVDFHPTEELRPLTFRRTTVVVEGFYNWRCALASEAGGPPAGTGPAADPLLSIGHDSGVKPLSSNVLSIHLSLVCHPRAHHREFGVRATLVPLRGLRTTAPACRARADSWPPMFPRFHFLRIENPHRPPPSRRVEELRPFRLGGRHTTTGLAVTDQIDAYNPDCDRPERLAPCSGESPSGAPLAAEGFTLSKWRIRPRSRAVQDEVQMQLAPRTFCWPVPGRAPPTASRIEDRVIFDFLGFDWCPTTAYISAARRVRHHLLSTRQTAGPRVEAAGRLNGAVSARSPSGCGAGVGRCARRYLPRCRPTAG